MLEQNYKYTARLEHAKNDIRNIYHEAVIAGSFDASDVSEIRVSHSDMSFHNPETRSQIIDKSIIEALNLSESEMAIVAPFLETFLEKGEGSQYRRDTGIMMFPMKDISDLAAHLNHVRMLRQLQEKGFKGRLMRVNRDGVDLMDASLYSGYRPGMTVEQILRGRIVEGMKKEIQKLLDSQKSKDKPLERIDF